MPSLRIAILLVVLSQSKWKAAVCFLRDFVCGLFQPRLHSHSLPFRSEDEDEDDDEDELFILRGLVLRQVHPSDWIVFTDLACSIMVFRRSP